MIFFARPPYPLNNSFSDRFPTSEPGGLAGDEGPMQDPANWTPSIPTSFRRSTFEFA